MLSVMQIQILFLCRQIGVKVKWFGIYGLDIVSSISTQGLIFALLENFKKHIIFIFLFFIYFFCCCCCMFFFSSSSPKYTGESEIKFRALSSFSKNFSFCIKLVLTCLWFYIDRCLKSAIGPSLSSVSVNSAESLQRFSERTLFFHFNFFSMEFANEI